MLTQNFNDLPSPPWLILFKVKYKEIISSGLLIQSLQGYKVDDLVIGKGRQGVGERGCADSRNTINSSSKFEKQNQKPKQKQK